MMKKNFMFAMMSAIALSGTMGLSSCSSAEDVVDQELGQGNPQEEEKVNPTYDSERNEVTTQFVLNVASQNKTRSSSTTVQRNSNFRGMQDAKIIGLSTGHSAWQAPFDGSATSGYAVNKTYNLGMLYGATAVNNEGTHNQDNSSRRVLELAMPIGTDAMLVYAKAISTTGNESEEGKVSMNVAAAPENTTFSLATRIGARQTEYDQTCALAVKILNRIIDSEVEELAAGQWSRNDYTNTAVLPAISWKGLGASLAAHETLSPLEEILAKSFNTLTTINPGEYRAGSASAISSIAHNVYNTAKSIYDATATTDGELNAQRLANDIIRRISNYFENYESELTTAYLNLANIKSHMMEATGISSTDFDNAYGLVQHGDLKGFPTSFGLPLGVALLNYSDATGFTHMTTPTSLIDKSSTLAITKYMYPSELMYFDNSPIRTNNNTVAASAYPNGYNTWTQDGNWAGWTTGAVTSSTRSVAVKNNINYGVAMLQTKVTLDGVNFEDNRHEITGETNQTLTEAEVEQFQLVGVLVGNQNYQVGWNYLAKTTTGTDWSYVIYDNKIPGTGTIPTRSGEENYTLVFDNYIPDDTQTGEVLIALEFKNNGRDFYGIGNMIRQGGTFYLVGKLKLANATNSITWPTTYAVPPYNASGASQQISRVFVQDFMTTANFKIGANSLKSAFVTVPDLRSSQTSLGLSVDLNWQTGLDFEAILGAE